jgi:hypothetical protein
MRQEAKMKRFLIAIGILMVVFALPMLFYVQAADPVGVKNLGDATNTGGQKYIWNQAGSGFELTSRPAALPAPVQKEPWNRLGSGFELTSLSTPLATPAQKDVWNRAGSGFELTSVRTITEIKASVQKYMWNRAGSGFELTSTPAALSAPVQK